MNTEKKPKDTANCVVCGQEYPNSGVAANCCEAIKKEKRTTRYTNMDAAMLEEQMQKQVPRDMKEHRENALVDENEIDEDYYYGDGE